MTSIGKEMTGIGKEVVWRKLRSWFLQEILYRMFALSLLLIPSLAFSADDPEAERNALFSLSENLRHVNEEDLPEEWRPYLENIRKVAGTQGLDLFFITSAYFTGYMPLVLMSPTLNKMPNVSKTFKGFMTGLPPVIAGVLRIITGRHTDAYGGRAAFIVPLTASFAGLMGLAAFNWALGEEGLENLTDENWLLLMIPMSAGVVAGFGLSTYSTAAAMSAYSGTARSASGRNAISGGVGNLAPGLSLLSLSFLLQGLPLHYAYLVWAGVAVVGTGMTIGGLNPSRYHQFLKQGLEAATARDLAQLTGQENFPDLRSSSLLTTFLLRDFDGQGKLVLANLCLDYVAITGTSFAITTFLPLALKTRMGFSPELALMWGGVFSILTALSRAGSGVLAPYIFHGHNQLTSTLSLLGVAAGGLGLWASGTYLPGVFAAAFVVALSQGLGKYAVVGRVKDLLDTRIGVALGFLGCFPSLLSPALSGAMGYLATYDENDGGSEGWGGFSFEYLVLPATVAVALIVNKLSMPRRTP